MANKIFLLTILFTILFMGYISALECSDITVSSTMDQNLSINGTSCFNITSSDVVLDCAGFTIRGNLTTSTNGVFAKDVTNVTVQNCIINGFNWGINATNTNNSLFQNNNISNSTRGFVLDKANNNVIMNSNLTATTSTWDLDSLWLTRNSRNNTINNTFARSGTNAIGFGSGSKWNTFINFSTVNSNYFYYIDANNSFINSTRGGREIYFRSKGNFDSRSECPASISNLTDLGWVYLYGCNNIVVTNVTINRGGSSSSGGFYLSNINDGVFSNLSVIGLTWGNALALESCDRNNFQDINLTTGDMTISASSVDYNSFNNIYAGGYLGLGNTPTHNSFTNVKFLSSSYGIYSGWSGGTNNSIINATFNQVANPLLVQSSYVSLIFLNVSFNKSKFVATPASVGNLSVRWYFGANVTDSTGTPISGAVVEVYNNTNNLVVNLTTRADGLTGLNALEEYQWNNSAFFYQTNYTINVSASGYTSQSVGLNLTNNTLLNIPMIIATPPQWSLNSTNSTTVGVPVLHSVYWTDNVNLNNYVFSYCNGTYNKTTVTNTSTYYNASAVRNNITYTLGAQPTVWANGFNTADVTSSEILTSLAFNDNNNWTMRDLTTTDVDLLGTFNFTIAETPSTITSIEIWMISNTNSSSSSEDIRPEIANFSNSTWVTIGTDLWARTTVTATFTDANNLIAGDQLMLALQGLNMDSGEVLKTDYVQIRVNASTRSYSNESCLDADPSFTNDSWVSMTGATNWSNITMVLNSTVGSTIRWRVWAQDNSSNLNVTDIFVYNTTAGEADTCTYTSGNWVVNCNDNCSITSNVALGGNNISITGTGTFTTTANITNWKKLLVKGTDSANICRVRTSGGGGFRQ